MMITRTFIIYGIFLKCVTAVTGANLVNDTCGTVSIRDDISNRTAKVTCIDDARVSDPKSQNGSYLLNDIGNWAGEIFACLCSCRVPLDLKNGQILSKNKIPHGEVLNVSCDEGYEKSIETNIVCLDGLLMSIPGFINVQYVNISTRLKSLPDWFANKFDGKVFDLWVNESVNWSVPVTELQKNQKVFQILNGNETILQYYLCKEKGCMLGCVNLSMDGLDCISLKSRDLERNKKLSETTTDVSSSQGLSRTVIAVIVLGVVVPVVVVIVIVIVVLCKRGVINKRQCCKNQRKGKKESQDNPDMEEVSAPLQQQASQEQTKQAVQEISQ